MAIIQKEKMDFSMCIIMILILARRTKLLAMSDGVESVLVYLSLPNRAWIPSHGALC